MKNRGTITEPNVSGCVETRCRVRASAPRKRGTCRGCWGEVTGRGVLFCNREPVRDRPALNFAKRKHRKRSARVWSPHLIASGRVSFQDRKTTRSQDEGETFELTPVTFTQAALRLRPSRLTEGRYGVIAGWHESLHLSPGTARVGCSQPAFLTPLHVILALSLGSGIGCLVTRRLGFGVSEHQCRPVGVGASGHLVGSQ